MLNWPRYYGNIIVKCKFQTNKGFCVVAPTSAPSSELGFTLVTFLVISTIKLHLLVKICEANSSQSLKQVIS